MGPWLKISLVGVVLLLASIALATTVVWIFCNLILDHDLFFVVLLVQGTLFGVPLFLGIFLWLVRRWRRPKIMEGRRRIFEG